MREGGERLGVIMGLLAALVGATAYKNKEEGCIHVIRAASQATKKPFYLAIEEVDAKNVARVWKQGSLLKMKTRSVMLGFRSYDNTSRVKLNITGRV